MVEREVSQLRRFLENPAKLYVKLQSVSLPCARAHCAAGTQFQAQKSLVVPMERSRAQDIDI